MILLYSIDTVYTVFVRVKVAKWKKAMWSFYNCIKNTMISPIVPRDNVFNYFSSIEAIALDGRRNISVLR